jgi:hypothetical protein
LRLRLLPLELDDKPVLRLRLPVVGEAPNFHDPPFCGTACGPGAASRPAASVRVSIMVSTLRSTVAQRPHWFDPDYRPSLATGQTTSAPASPSSSLRPAATSRAIASSFSASPSGSAPSVSQPKAKQSLTSITNNKSLPLLPPSQATKPCRRPTPPVTRTWNLRNKPARSLAMPRKEPAETSGNGLSTALSGSSPVWEPKAWRCGSKPCSSRPRHCSTSTDRPIRDTGSGQRQSGATRARKAISRRSLDGPYT